MQEKEAEKQKKKVMFASTGKKKGSFTELSF